MLRKVAVMMGGRSGEHEVSIASGTQVIKHLDPDKYKIMAMLIAKEKGLTVWDEVKDPLRFDTSTGGRFFNTLCDGIEIIINSGIDIIFLALHGPFGEDGSIQGLLELTRVPYTGSRVLSSAMCLDKIMARYLMASSQIAVPPALIFSSHQIAEMEKDVILKIENTFGYPVVVKSPNLGSSVGMDIVHNRDSLLSILKAIVHLDNRILVEQFISGRELTCGVVEMPPDWNPVALPPTEIIPKAGPYFNYEAKYEKGGSLEITPPDLPKDIIEQIQKLAVKIHTLFGCRGMSRTDIILAEKPYVLEINTIPGLTETSLLPQETNACGISFSRLCDIIIDRSLYDSHKEQLNG